MNTAQQFQYPLPAEVEPFRGRISDTDGHDCCPFNYWEDVYGSVVKPLHDAVRAAGLVSILEGERDADDEEISEANVSGLRLCNAPGAFDLDRRIEVMDFYGIHRQIHYPDFVPLFAANLYGRADDVSLFASITGDRKAYARKLFDAYNDLCIRLTKKYDRLRYAAVLLEESPEDLYATAKRLIDQGIRCLWVTPDRLPGGVSPADPRLDRFYALLADADVPLLAHSGNDGSFLSTTAWREAPAFQGYKLGGEFWLDPWTLTNLHISVKNFVMTMCLGGVFMRHPRLRFGTAEYSADWVGSLADNMDFWYNARSPLADIGDFSSRQELKERPSFYLRQNVRVMPFEIEDVGGYIRKYGFDECYCFGSDYPHVEGGKRPIEKFVKSLRGLGEDVLRRFFVDNGAWLLPD